MADNLQATLPVLARALDERNPGPILSLVADCEAAGADGIDVNTGPLGRRGQEKVAFLVETVQTATRLPLVVDTADPDAMAVGAAACRKPPILNGCSLEPVKLERILPLAAAHDADLVAYLLTPEGHVPRSTDERLAVAVDLYQAAAAAGVPGHRLIVDPVVAPLVWENGLQLNRDLLDILRTLPDVLGFPVRTMAGLSNLTTGHHCRSDKIRLEQAFVPMLAASGLDMLLLDIRHTETVRTARTCDLMLKPGVFSWASLP